MGSESELGVGLIGKGLIGALVMISCRYIGSVFVCTVLEESRMSMYDARGSSAAFFHIFSLSLDSLHVRSTLSEIERNGNDCQ